MSGKKAKKGKSKGKKKNPNDGPSVNEMILKKSLKLYDAYCQELSVKCCPDVVRAIRASLEEDTPLTKVTNL